MDIYEIKRILIRFQFKVGSMLNRNSLNPLGFFYNLNQNKLK